MQLKGIVRVAELVENPPDSGQIELQLRLQGVGPGQPRLIVVPYSLLIEEESLDPDQILGCGFQAEVEDEGGRWLVTSIQVAGRVLRPPE